jgi:putative spermidine/putrescine transport system ATP-binding protein
VASSLQTEPSSTEDDSADRPFLTIQGLRKHYGSVVAADMTRLDARRGQLLTLLGPSGCGKTTTLRCIAGLVNPDAGAIVVNGRNITTLPTHRRNLGMVFQNYAIFPHMTVHDNVAYGLQNRGLSRQQLKVRVDEALSLVELTGFEHRYRHQLSGGQQQRVALARAVAYQPDVLLLDEPFSNLDAKLRKTMRRQVRKLQQRLQLTTVFVTHDQQEALSLSDVVAVMTPATSSRLVRQLRFTSSRAPNSWRTSLARPTSCRESSTATRPRGNRRSSRSKAAQRCVSRTSCHSQLERR